MPYFAVKNDQMCLSLLGILKSMPPLVSVSFPHLMILGYNDDMIKLVRIISVER